MGCAAEEREKEDQVEEEPREPQEVRQGRAGEGPALLDSDHGSDRMTGNALTVWFSNMEFAGDLVRDSLLGTKA